MRSSSFRLALGAALVLPVASMAAAGECPLAAAKKAQATTHVQTVAYKAEAKDIVDTAVAAGSFKTLVAAVQAAGLVETLKGEGPFTVFAPTDEAFAKLPEGTVETLLKPENKEKLVAVLTYHVVPGKVMAADVVKLTEAPTVQGSKAKVKVEDGTVMIDGAKVVKTDIVTSNGVIHVIDAVILPPETK
jgi:transforming growth factor-beta-induced protein